MVKHDNEGRLVLTEFDGFTLVNVYIPNGGRGDHHIEYKLNYYDEMLDIWSGSTRPVTT